MSRICFKGLGSLSKKVSVFALANFALAFMVVDLTVAQTPRLKLLSAYWNSQRGDNFATATSTGRRSAIDAGYVSLGGEACILAEQVKESAPLNLYWSAERGDNFTTATKQGAADAKRAGYVFVRTEGYVFTKQRPNTVPLYLYWSAERGDNFTTPTIQGVRDAQDAGYVRVRTEGYVYRSNWGCN